VLIKEQQIIKVCAVGPGQQGSGFKSRVVVPGFGAEMSGEKCWLQAAKLCCLLTQRVVCVITCRAGSCCAVLCCVQESDILYFFTQVHKLQPGFFISLDRQEKKLVWVIRGESTVD
jgi:hypothetical protein